MRAKIVGIILLAATFFVGRVEANELTSFEPVSVQDEALKNSPDTNPESLGLPIYPNAKEIVGNTLTQGGFEARTFTFSIPAGFQKVLNFYKSRLSSAAKLNMTQGSGKQKAHFYVVAGSQSRNVIVEEISRQETRLVLTVFQGGGEILS
jgi:hypothetical protein